MKALLLPCSIYRIIVRGPCVDSAKNGAILNHNSIILFLNLLRLILSDDDDANLGLLSSNPQFLVPIREPGSVRVKISKTSALLDFLPPSYSSLPPSDCTVHSLNQQNGKRPVYKFKRLQDWHLFCPRKCI